MLLDVTLVKNDLSVLLSEPCNLNAKYKRNIGQHFTALTAEQNPQHFATIFRGIVAGDVPGAFIVHVRHADGSLLDLECTAVPQYADGAVVGVEVTASSRASVPRWILASSRSRTQEI